MMRIGTTSAPGASRRDRGRSRAVRLALLLLPPIVTRAAGRLLDRRPAYRKVRLPAIPPEYAALDRGGYGLFRLLRDFGFDSVLDVGSGGGEHAALLHAAGKTVTALDFGRSVYYEHRVASRWTHVTGDFLHHEFPGRFDCVWASHVLEHQPDPGAFLGKCIALLGDDGILAITVPPLREEIVGGHLTLWNAGLLLYHLAFAGLDCRDASICAYGYNITVIVRKRLRPAVDLDYDKGDIARLKPWMPPFVEEPFDGRIQIWNWRL